jgi:hypothetical protein
MPGLDPGISWQRLQVIPETEEIDRRSGNVGLKRPDNSAGSEVRG